MTKNISNERETLNKFLDIINSNVVEGGLDVIGKWRITITRADGSEEERILPNIVTKDGLDTIASRTLDDTTSPFKYLIIGTATAAGSLGSVQGGIGEVARKIGATIASSNEVAILVATWAGDADGITSVVFGTAGMINHASSGSGTFGNHVSSVNATLADSDFLKLQMEVQIGSHAL